MLSSITIPWPLHHRILSSPNARPVTGCKVAAENFPLYSSCVFLFPFKRCKSAVLICFCPLSAVRISNTTLLFSMYLIALCVPDVQARSEFLMPHPTQICLNLDLAISYILLVFTGWDLVLRLLSLHLEKKNGVFTDFPGIFQMQHIQRLKVQSW